ncbi:endolytic transglycosylase MltG [Bacillus massiliglaciei]|uniref:endolytic transglycosylase MltG n=1 Tax=Bacillus massiliglaciei TaxID=1816693 RepID=UPI000DA5FAD9|nr:endolytic transglycosylase MltG [Bacillus massiliglaciei]
MMKAALQGFAAGLIVSASIMAGVRFLGSPEQEEAKPQTMDVSEAKAFLEQKGYTVTEDLNKASKKDTASKTENVKKPEETKEKEQVHSFKLTVKSNMNSQEIASILEKEHIIKDAGGFEAYMNEKGLSKRIQIGEFVLTDSMSYSQIGKTLTN